MPCQSNLFPLLICSVRLCFCIYPLLFSPLHCSGSCLPLFLALFCSCQERTLPCAAASISAVLLGHIQPVLQCSHILSSQCMCASVCVSVSKCFLTQARVLSVWISEWFKVTTHFSPLLPFYFIITYFFLFISLSPSSTHPLYLHLPLSV